MKLLAGGEKIRLIYDLRLLGGGYAPPCPLALTTLNSIKLTGAALGFQIDGAADFFCALNPCQITGFYILMVLLKWLMQYPKKLTVRLHHAHPSNAAPVLRFSRV